MTGSPAEIRGGGTHLPTRRAGDTRWKGERLTSPQRGQRPATSDLRSRGGGRHPQPDPRAPAHAAPRLGSLTPPRPPQPPDPLPPPWSTPRPAPSPEIAPLQPCTLTLWGPCRRGHCPPTNLQWHPQPCWSGQSLRVPLFCGALPDPQQAPMGPWGPLCPQARRDNGPAAAGGPLSVTCHVRQPQQPGRPGQFQSQFWG